MHEMILESMELIIDTIALFMVRKYVFFEPELDARKQRIFYGITFLVAFTVLFTVGLVDANMVMWLMVGINICLARKKHRITGIFVTFPVLGIAAGLLTPFENQIPYFLSMSEQVEVIYHFTLYGALLLLLVIFYIKGKSWRSWFNENMQDRSLSRSERWLLYICGIMLISYADGDYGEIDSLKQEMFLRNQEYARQLDVFMNIRTIIIFFATIAIIGLILRGTKRSLYYKKIAGMQSGMITLMADMVENRDDNTGGHIKRTARYVESIAKELKRRGAYQNILTDEYVRELVVAAPLHDIGKIHVPDDVLNKPGRLTDDEFDIMKSHTTAGHDLLIHAKEELGEYGYLTMAVEMATYHHEWWNGKGYPYGISGNDIPLCARIMAVADVFDALISKRIYKDAMPLEKAYAIIREESGTHFEPEIVDAFFEVADGLVVEEA